jgi:hypothetical protein
VCKLDKGTIHIYGDPAAWSLLKTAAQFTTYELFVPGMFHVIILDQSLPQMTENAENEVLAKRGRMTVISG